MSKKAKEVVEAVPKFAQPWQGFLSFGVIIMIAYVALMWFFHPVWGWLTKMVQANAFVAYNFFGAINPAFAPLGIIFSLNNPMLMELYPLGYLVNWVSYFILCIVWFISIAFLARPFAPMKSRIGKQPLMGLILLALTMILAFVTWYIFAMVLKWKAYEIIMLGTIGFFIFPIWVSLFNYWPFIPKRPQTHAIIRGAIFIALSWLLAFLIRFIAAAKMQLGSPTTVYSQQYALNGSWFFTYPLTAITPTEPWDFVISVFLAFIVASSVISVLNLFPNMSQPKRGLLNFMLAILVGLILWGIIVAVLGPSIQGVLIPYTASTSTIAPVPYINHGAVAAYLAFPLVVLLFGQLTFQMWPWSRWGAKGNWIWVIMTFIIGTIIYYIMMVNPGYASAITGANLIPSASGLQTLYLFSRLSGLLYNYWALLMYFEGLATTVGKAIMYTWTLTVVIFYLLIYEGFEHWPWK